MAGLLCQSSASSSLQFRREYHVSCKIALIKYNVIGVVQSSLSFSSNGLQRNHPLSITFSSSAASIIPHSSSMNGPLLWKFQRQMQWEDKVCVLETNHSWFLFELFLFNFDLEYHSIHLAPHSFY